MSEQPKDIKNPIVQIIDRIGRERGLSWAKISSGAGLSPDFISKLESRGAAASANARNLITIANTLGIDAATLINAGQGSDVAPPGAVRSNPSARPAASARGMIPILGSAAGSAIGTFIISNTPVGYVRRPPALDFVDNAYALYVENDSMTPAYPAGSLVFVNPARPPNTGDTVIVQTRTSAGEMQAWIKYLVRKSPEWLITRQLNPEAEVKFSRAQVVSVHKVPTLAELFGA